MFAKQVSEIKKINFLVFQFDRIQRNDDYSLNTSIKILFKFLLQTCHIE